MIDELEKNINLCLDTYRGSNIAARKASNSPNPPKYFDKKFEYDQKERDYKIIYRDSLQDVALLNEPEKKNKATNDYIEINNRAHTDISKILESDREKMLHHFGKLKDIMKKPPTPSAPIVRLVDKENKKMD